MMPFEDRAQGVIRSLDEGAGLTAVRTVLFLVFIVAVFLTYACLEFTGLSNAEAMEYAQLGRNVASSRGFVTSCIRPADLWFARQRRETVDPARFTDLRHGPVFPSLLAGGFRLLRPSFDVGDSRGLFRPEGLVIVPACTTFSLLSALFIFLLARRLFTRRVGVVAVLVYCLGETVLEQNVSGTPASLLSFLVASASYFAVVSAQANEGRMSRARCAVAFAVAAGLSGCMFLTKYRAAALLPAPGLFLVLSFRRRWLAGAAFATLVALVVAPWVMRNMKVSGTPLGTALYTVVYDTQEYPGDSFDRTVAPRADSWRVAAAVRAKLLPGFRRMYDLDLRTMGSGLLVCFFLVSLFRGSAWGGVGRLRWCTALGLALSLVADALHGAGGAAGVSQALLPLVAVCGVGFFDQFMHETENMSPGLATVLTWALVGATALPAALTLTGPPSPGPYPPYYPPYVSYVAGFVRAEEAICTDIPWATAWYGDRTSILLPLDLEEFERLGWERHAIGGLYLTTETGRRPLASPHGGSLNAWHPLLERRVPPGFPFDQGIALPPGTYDQIFLTREGRIPARPSAQLPDDERAGPTAEQSPTS